MSRHRRRRHLAGGRCTVWRTDPETGVAAGRCRHPLPPPPQHLAGSPRVTDYCLKFNNSFLVCSAIE